MKYHPRLLKQAGFHEDFQCDFSGARLRTCKVPTSACEIRSFTDARWMCLEPQPSEYSRGTWHLCIFPSKDGWEWW